ncbi:MAG: hypothetical protein A2Y38_09465 [Spirochaetes bacterium GWB1_59_5]|nr:MAG: hypothetical protein A2Y38_09465 [Spirochaetes bacterium GWB1_59_5]
MKTTGYKLQHALRELHHRRDMAASQFDDGLHQFEDDGKETPTEAFKVFSATEAQIAKLEVAQARYNLGQRVTVQGESMTLAEAVKRVGGAGRMEKMWRSIAAPKKDRYGYDHDLVRDASQERAKRTVSYKEAGDFAQKASRFASALREAIQVANSAEVEIEDLTPALFE